MDGARLGKFGVAGLRCATSDAACPISDRAFSHLVQRIHRKPMMAAMAARDAQSCRCIITAPRPCDEVVSITRWYISSCASSIGILLSKEKGRYLGSAPLFRGWLRQPVSLPLCAWPTVEPAPCCDRSLLGGLPRLLGRFLGSLGQHLGSLLRLLGLLSLGLSLLAGARPVFQIRDRCVGGVAVDAREGRVRGRHPKVLERDQIANTHPTRLAIQRMTRASGDDAFTCSTRRRSALNRPCYAAIGADAPAFSL